MEDVCISEASVCSSEATRRYIRESSHLHTRRRENLKSHGIISLLFFRILCWTGAAYLLKLDSWLYKTDRFGHLLHDFEFALLLAIN
jgi:hypothetical protein